MFNWLNRTVSRKSWTLLDIGEEVHILPGEDKLKHYRADCFCGPNVVSSKRVHDGFPVLFVQHKPFDGVETRGFRGVVKL